MTDAAKTEAGAQKTQAEGNGSQTSGEKSVAELMADFAAKEQPKSEAATETKVTEKPKAKKAEGDDDDEDARFQRYEARRQVKDSATKDLKALSDAIAAESGMDEDVAHDWLTARMLRDQEVMGLWFVRDKKRAEWKAVAEALQREYSAKVEKAVKSRSPGRSDRAAAMASARIRNPGASAKSSEKFPDFRQPGAYDNWRREHPEYND